MTAEEREERIVEAWEQIYSVVDFLDYADRYTIKTAINDLIKLQKAKAREEAAQ